MNAIVKPFEGYEAEDYAHIMPDLEGFETLQANLLAEWLMAHFTLDVKEGGKGIIDVGCGSMFYLTPYLKKVRPIFGIDAMEHPHFANYERVDLRLPWKPDGGRFIRGANDKKKENPYRFSLALCLEVVEHLPKEFEDTLFDTLAACSDTIVFSGAVPGQMGTHHHNEQPTAHWLEQFSKRGYALHPRNEAFQTWLQSLTPLREAYKVCGWLIDHTFILQKKAQA